MKIHVYRANDMATLPTFGSRDAAGADLAWTSLVPKGNILVCHTGLHVEIPQGHVMLLFPRSGLARKFGVNLVNGVGVIDSDYRGEIQVMLQSDIYTPTGLAWVLEKEAILRICQAVIVPVPQVSYADVMHLAELEDTERGEGGFGSTGS